MVNNVAASVEGLFQPSTGIPKTGVQQGGLAPIIRNEGELKVYDSPAGDAPVIEVITDEKSMIQDGLIPPSESNPIQTPPHIMRVPQQRRPRSPMPRQNRVSFASNGGDAYDPYLDSMAGDNFADESQGPSQPSVYKQQYKIVKGE